MQNIKIVFFGTPVFATTILEGLIQANYDVIGVVTQLDKIRGKNKIPSYSPVKELALAYHIPVYQPVRLKEDYQFLKDLHFDLLITCAYGQILPQAVLDLAKINNINVHASLLPRWRGGAPIHRAIINGDTKTGITIMKMVQKMDAGCMYAQKEIPIDHHMNTTELFQQLQYVGKDLLLETLPSIISKANQGIEQDENEVTYAPNIRREEEKIDFNKKCFEVHNLIRGLAMTPGAYCFFKGKTCKIFQTEFSDFKLSCSMEPGTLKIQDKRLLVCCADGYLEILKLQLEGKKMMTAKDFLNGHKIEQLEREQLL